MKAQQIQAQFDSGTRSSIRKHGRKRLLCAIAAAAAIVMIGGTLTVGAINDWNYNSLMNNYFNKWFGAKSDYDFEGQGIDIKDTFVTDDYQLTVKSAVFNADMYYVFYDFIFTGELAEQVDAIGEDASVDIAPYAEILVPGQKPQYGHVCYTGTIFRNEEGVYEIMQEYPFPHESGKDFSALQLAVTPGRIGVKRIVNHEKLEPVFSNDWEFEKALDTAPETLFRTYSLDPVENAPGIYLEMPVTLDIPSVVPDVPDKPFTFDSISVTPTGLRLYYTAENDTEEEREQNSRVSLTNFATYFNDTKLRLIYDSGKKITLRGPLRGGTSSTELGDDGKLKSCEITAEFEVPVSTEGLTEIRFNHNSIILNKN